MLSSKTDCVEELPTAVAPDEFAPLLSNELRVVAKEYTYV